MASRTEMRIGGAVRITVDEAREKMLSLTPPLLVLAYEDDHKFRTFGIEGAIPFSVLASRLGTLPKDREIIFYCCCPDEVTATALAAKFTADGYQNVMILKGGAQAWVDEGYPLAGPATRRIGG
jgi:rhodanese-related sulfurtransferase